jgi:hypothetical protein
MLHHVNRESSGAALLGHRNSTDESSEAEFSPAFHSRTMQDLDEHINAGCPTSRF